MRGDSNIGEGLMLLDVTEIASDLPEIGIELGFPELAGGFLTTEPPGEAQI